jgi:hypothetical protein
MVVVLVRRIVMLSKTAIALIAASLALGFAALTPAMANYAPCYENPAAAGCPGATNQNTHSNRGAEHQAPWTRHHG